MKRSVMEAYEPAVAAAKKRRRPSVMPLVVFAAEQRIVRGFERAIAQADPLDRASGPEHLAARPHEAPTRGVTITDIY